MASLNIGKEAEVCLASSSEHKPFKTDYIRRVPFKLKCPGSILDKCGKNEHVWRCKKCNKLILRDLDNYFYCDCGKAKGENFVFKCSSGCHGPDYIAFPQGIMDEFLKELPELNILVIGVDEEDTSVWLNSLVNSLAFPTLKEAIDGLLVSVIPINFQIVDKDGDLHNVKFGSGSVNQIIGVNAFIVRGSLVKIIDVPGFRKCSEVENIKKHYQYLLQYLGDLKMLHRICFVPKISFDFELCFREFLNYFDMSIIENIIFCFEANESAKMLLFLRQLMRENKQNVSLDAARLYNTHNDCFRYICAIKQGIKFKDIDANVFSVTWLSLVKESERLVSYFERIKPHDVSITLAMVRTRKFGIYLSKAIAIAIENVTRNLVQIRCDIDNYKMSLKSTQIKLSHVEIKSFINDRIVCRNSKCCNLILNSYPICHDGCFLDDATLECNRDSKIKDCVIMGNGENLYCSSCGCFWDQHVKIAFDQEINQNEQRRMFDAININNGPSVIKDLELEKCKIIESSIKIGLYLTKVSLKSFKDQVLQHMQSLINRKRSEQKDNSLLVEKLIASRDTYFTDERHFHKLNVNGIERSECVTLLNELYTLEYSGKLLKTTVELKDRVKLPKLEIPEEFFDLSMCVVEKKKLHV